MSAEFDFEVSAGETFQPVFRWGTDALISKAITAISQAAGAVVSCAAHGIPDGWPVAVVSAKGVTEINATRYPPRGDDWHAATVVTDGTVQLNDVNTSDFPAYTSGGFLVWNTPVDLAAAKATLVIRDAPITGTVLVTLTSTPASGIVLDNTDKTISATLETVALTWTLGYYDLELDDGSGSITQLFSGTIAII